MISRIRSLFYWSYGMEKRHTALILGAGISWIALYVANLTADIPFVLAVAFLAAPFVIVWAVVQASIEEQATLALWSFHTVIGAGVLNIAIHSVITTPLTLSQFQQSHPIGLIFTAFAGVALGIFVVSTVTVLLNLLWRWKKNRSNGATPEERVLSEDEYAEFEPIEETSRVAILTRLLLAREAERTFLVSSICAKLIERITTWNPKIK